MPKVNIKIGCDPELWIRDRKTGEIVSAHTLLPGTKVEPFKVERGAIQVDGAAAEFNTDPAINPESFVFNVNHVLNNIRDRVKETHDLVLNPTATFSPSYFDTLPDLVKELGCNPDFNAWTGQVNPAPDGDKTTMRTASGHIHIGWLDRVVNPHDPNHFEDCRFLIRELDYYVGIYTLLWDPDGARRSLYGKAGAFRPKTYGAEYRTPSNVWLRSKNIQDWLFRATYSCTKNLLDGKPSVAEKFKDWARHVIDENQINWNTTKIGKQVHQMTNLSMPNVTECLNYSKIGAEPVKVMSKLEEASGRIWKEIDWETIDSSTFQRLYTTKKMKKSI